MSVLNIDMNYISTLDLTYTNISSVSNNISYINSRLIYQQSHILNFRSLVILVFFSVSKVYSNQKVY